VAGKIEQKLDWVRGLREASHEEAVAGLRKALGDKSNLVVSKAAAVAELRGLHEVVPDLSAAFARWFGEGDSQCWAKNVLAKAMLALEVADDAVWKRGLRHVQMEGAYGGPVDVAVTLRATCAIGLATCTRLPAVAVLNLLAERLMDAEYGVRLETARAIGMLNAPEGEPVLRLKVFAGDQEPRVLGACFDALIALRALEFVAERLWEGDEDVRMEAAAALGGSRDDAAFAALKGCYEGCAERRMRKAVLIAMGASRNESALAYLIGMIEPGATGVIEALAPHRYHDDARRRIEEAVVASRNTALLRVFEKEFNG
jgi:HEAT repeat protein